MATKPLLIGVGSNTIDADSTTYLTDYNFVERKVIVWDPVILWSEIESRLQCSLSTRIGYELQDKIAQELDASGKKLFNFLNHDGDLIVILRHLDPIPFTDRYGNFDSIDLIEKNFLNFAKPIKRTGTSVAASAPQEIEGALTALLALELEYTAIVSSNIEPLLVVENSGEKVGAYVKLKNGGQIIFLPPPKGWTKGSQDGQNARDSFLKIVLGLPGLLPDVKQSSDVAILPLWAETYRLPKEQIA